MAPRGFTNPAPRTESARSALSSFTCTLCNKSYSRHPEYEAHIGSYDHQHRKRLQDLKQLTRDPNAIEKNRRAERKADAQAGLKVIETPGHNVVPSGGGTGFKKGGFKSSFATVKGTVVPTAPVKKNVLGDDEEDNIPIPQNDDPSDVGRPRKIESGDMESETDEEYGPEGHYDPHRPTDCYAGCATQKV
ncbi:Zinc finger C2H2 [Penicillium concentricum]|uniref:Zinc finger C2H2 n=1 Tax=Penicillium concentricum TaxID=293559 RepID=A0A9W9SYG5_9EURO|nr:Zinc finger C2H2 [Penicillium concentricum]KAJ5385363.1 Zinc finger C2H2 [Penicillium concentricum]